MKLEDVEKGIKLIKNHPNYIMENPRPGHETSDAYYISKRKVVYFPCQKRGCPGVYHFRLQFASKQVGTAVTLEELKAYLDKDFFLKL